MRVWKRKSKGGKGTHEHVYLYTRQSFISRFLVADTQLHKRRCPSFGPSVRRSVDLWKSAKMSVLDGFCVCVRGMGYGWGLDAPAHPRHMFFFIAQTVLHVACIIASLYIFGVEMKESIYASTRNTT